jgi:hypothetical protein
MEVCNMKKTRIKVSNVLHLLCLILVLALGFATIVATGGGGGGGGSAPSGGTGTVALSIADSPTDDYCAIYITITEVSLLPGPVVLFSSSAGKEINILDHQENNDYLLKVKHGVPAGDYSKIRLKVSDIRAEPKPGELAPCTNNIKLPSNRIDLNPQGTFQVRPGGKLLIKLDFQANKALDIHPAGKSGKCIFRPVVFVDIQEGKFIYPCPKIIEGTIEEITEYDSTGEPTEFILKRAENNDELRVMLLPDSIIFDGDFLSPSALIPLEGTSQIVKVIGTLDENLGVQASIVVIGDVLNLKGNVDTAFQFDDATMTVGQFKFTPFAGEEIVGQVDVQVFQDETSILLGCKTKLQPEDIMPGMSARIIGKYITGASVLRAVAVFLKPQKISGKLLSWYPTSDGNYLILDVDGVTVHVPRQSEPGFPYNQFYPIYLDVDDLVPLSLLCNDGVIQRQVHVTLDPYVSNPLIAKEVRVESEPPEGISDEVDQNNTPFEPVLLMNSGERVYVLPGATILDQRPGATKLSLSEIEPGFAVLYHGLAACDADPNADFYAFILQVIP